MISAIVFFWQSHSFRKFKIINLSYLESLTNQSDRTIMQCMKSIAQILFLMLGVVISIKARPARPQLCRSGRGQRRSL